METEYTCNLCNSWLEISQLKCSNSNCGKLYQVLRLAPVLTRLTVDEVKLLFAFVLVDGNISKTASALGKTKYHTRAALKDLKAKFILLAREEDLVQKYRQQ